MVFFGIPPEALKYTRGIVQMKDATVDWPQEDQARLLNAIRLNIGMKLAGATGAGYAAWATPGLTWVTVPILIPKAVVFFTLFRCMSVPAALQFEKVAHLLSLKHNLPPAS